MERIFFELIRVALGTAERLSRTPSAEEWQEVFGMAERQSLTGICFRGLQRLRAGAEGQTEHVGREFYAEWMGCAAMIERQNERMDRQCAFVARQVEEAGFRACIFKGRSVARRYGELRMLRQSGDIDVWLMAAPQDVLRWARSVEEVSYVGYHHLDLEVFSDTRLEVHYRPSLSRNLVRNARLQRWFREEGERLLVDGPGWRVPGDAFSIVLTLNHTFWHLLYEGVGMRHLMDLYFVVKGRSEALTQREVEGLLDRFRLRTFCAAAMWVLHEAFGLSPEEMLCEPDASRGRSLLQEVMMAGEFGQHDERRTWTTDGNRMELMWHWMKHNWRLIRQYPSDVLWTPLGVMYIAAWPKLRMKG